VLAFNLVIKRCWKWDEVGKKTEPLTPKKTSWHITCYRLQWKWNWIVIVPIKQAKPICRVKFALQIGFYFSTSNW